MSALRDRSDFAVEDNRPLIACDRYCLSSRQYRAAARAHGHRNDVAEDQKGCADAARLARGDRILPAADCCRGQVERP